MKVALVNNVRYSDTIKYVNGIKREFCHFYNGKITQFTFYDSLGNQTDDKFYDTSGNVTSRSTKNYIYGECGNILLVYSERTVFKKDSSSDTYTPDDIQRSYAIMTYDNDRLVSEVTYNLNDNGYDYDISSIYKKFLRFDSLGNLVEEESYFNNRHKYSKRLCFYDTNYRKIKEMSLDSAGVLQHSLSIAYNEQGNIIEELYESGTSIDTVQYQYDYGTDGKVLNRIVLSEDRKESTFNYYDSTGRLVKCCLYMGKQLYSLTIYTYNGDGEKIDEFNLNVCGCGYNHKELKLYKYFDGQLVEAIRIGGSIH
jgi:hypothetical protein